MEKILVRKGIQPLIPSTSCTAVTSYRVKKENLRTFSYRNGNGNDKKRQPCTENLENLWAPISGTTLGSKGPGQVSQYQAGLTLVGAGGTGTNPPMHNPTISGINAANKFNTISNVHKRGGGGGIGWNRSLLQEEQVENNFQSHCFSPLVQSRVRSRVIMSGEGCCSTGEEEGDW